MINSFTGIDIKEVPSFPEIKLEEPKTVWIDEDTQERILNEIPECHREIFLFLFRQGCRPSEARALQADDIDWRNKTVTIHRTFSGDVLKERTKSKNIRVLPLDDEVYEMLRNKGVISGFIFIDPDNQKPYYRFKLNYLWDKAVKKASLQHIKLYGGTRHSFASQAVNAGAPINLIGNFLGHSNNSTTKRYAHINTEGLKIVLKTKAKIKELNVKKIGPR